MNALREAYRSGYLDRSHWMANIVSGVVVGIVALPLAMAFAIASGARPEHGIYTAIVAGALVSIFGGSRVQIAGPTGAFIVILAGVTAEHGIAGLQIATLMAGVMLIMLGFGRLGAIIKYIPKPVIVGFTAGIGVVVWTGQWPQFFGLSAATGGHFHERVGQYLLALPDLHVPTTLLALGSLLVVIYSRRLPGMRRIPGPILALVAATGLQSVFEFDGIATIGSAFGGIPLGMPGLQLPEISLRDVLELIGPAFTIAMLGAIESLLSAVVADGMTGSRHDSNQELIGQGLANLVAPLFGGIAATGAIARTATNIRYGGTSPIAGISHSLTLVLIIALLAPLADNVPLATLAAILFVVAWNMSEAKGFMHIVQRAPRADIVILLVTFALTVFADLVVAVNIGVILATLHFMRRMAASVEVKQATQWQVAQGDGTLSSEPLPSDIVVYAIDGPFFFGAVESFESALASTHTEPRVLIIGLDRVPFVDMTGLQTLDAVLADLQRRGIRALIAGANPRVSRKLAKARLIDRIGVDNLFPDVTAAIAAAQADKSSAPGADGAKPHGLTAAARAMIETTRAYLREPRR